MTPNSVILTTTTSCFSRACADLGLRNFFWLPNASSKLRPEPSVQSTDFEECSFADFVT